MADVDPAQFADSSQLRSVAQAGNLIKLMLVGDGGVGKTCFAFSWAEDGFNSIHIPTIGFDNKDRAMRVNRKDYVVKIWDTAGSERFDSVTAQYYRDMEGFFILFDVTNMQSFKNAERWIAKIKTNTKNVPDIPFVLVGNKSDIPEPIRVVKKSKGVVFAKEKGCHYFETSSKLQTQIDECVTDLCHQSLSRRKEIEALRKNLKKAEGKKQPRSKEGSAVIDADQANRLSRTRIPSQSLGRTREKQSKSVGRTRGGRKNSFSALSMSKRSQSRGMRGKRKKCVIL